MCTIKYKVQINTHCILPGSLVHSCIIILSTSTCGTRQIPRGFFFVEFSRKEEESMASGLLLLQVHVYVTGSLE